MLLCLDFDSGFVEVGLSLRKGDSKTFKSIYLRIMEAISKVDKDIAHKR